jgi:hypothetical protein
MPRVPDSERKIAFTPRLKSKREAPSLSESRPMTPDQMRVFEKAFGEAARHVSNLGLMIFDPSPDQAEHLDDLLEGPADQIEAIRYRLTGP